MPRTPLFLQHVLIFLLLVAPVCLKAAEPAPGFLWTQKITNEVFQDAFGAPLRPRIVADHAQNIYLGTVFTGLATNGTRTFESSPLNALNILISKLGPDGALKWARRIGGAPCGSSVAVLFEPLASRRKPNWSLKQLDKRNEGQLHVIGTFRGTVEFGARQLTSETNSSRSALFLATYDPEGILVDARILGHLCSTVGECSGYDPQLKAAQDPQGNLILSGRFGDTITLGQTNLFSPGIANGVFLAHFDRSGSFRWARHGFSGYSGEIPLLVDRDGSILVAGEFYDYSDEGEPDFCENHSCGLAKFSVDGSLLWSRGGFPGVSALTGDLQDNLYFTGTFAEQVQLGDVILTNSAPNGRDLYIAKVTSAGVVLWARQVEGPADEFAADIAVDSDANVYATGWFNGDFLRAGGQHLPSAGSLFLAKYSGAGELVWLKGEPTFFADFDYFLPGHLSFGTSLAILPNGVVHVAGKDWRHTFVGRLAATHQASPPSFVQHPAWFQIAHEGDSTALSVQVTGRSPLSFIWKKEGEVLRRTTNPVLTLPNMSITQTGRYSVVATNALGMAASTVAHVELAPRSSLPQFDWALGAGGCDWEVGSCIALDPLGNAYVGGVFGGSAIFGQSNIVSKGQWDYFVAKYDRRGALVWVIAGGGPQDDELYDIAVDGTDTIYITGDFFDEKTGAQQKTTVKLDGHGRVLWTLAMGGDGVAVDGQSNLLITGEYWDDTFAGRFVAKFDSAGSFLWALTNAAERFSIGRKIATDGSGNIFLAGKHYGDLNSYLAESNSTPTFFVAKYSTSGQLLWVREATLTRDVFRLPVTLAVDSIGNSYITAGFEESLQLASVHFVASNRTDTLLAAFTPMGELRWARQIVGERLVYSEGLAVDGNGTVTVVGGFSGARFGHITLTSGFRLLDLFVARFDGAGNVIGVRQVAGVPYALPFAVAVTASGDAVITGEVGGNLGNCFSPQPLMSFGPHPIRSFGSFDFFVARIGL